MIFEKLIVFLDVESLKCMLEKNPNILGFVFRISHSKDFMILINFLYIIEGLVGKVPWIREVLLR